MLFPFAFMKRFCPSCGTEIIRGTLCRECSTPEFSYAPITPRFCVRCTRVFFKGKWAEFPNVEDGVSKAAVASIRAKVKILDFDVPEVKGPGMMLSFDIPVSYDGGECLIPVKLETTICERCSKQGTKYFEAVIQLRPARDDALTFLRNELRKQEKKGIFTNNETKVAQGIDFEITDQTYAKVLARKLKEQFGARVSKNEKLFSRSSQTSKDIFRLAVKIELPSFTNADMITFGHNHFQVSSVKKTLSVINLQTGQKTSLPIEDSFKTKYEVVQKCTAEITRIRPHLEVLHPETFESVPLENQDVFLKTQNSPPKDGDKIEVAFDTHGHAWGFL